MLNESRITTSVVLPAPSIYEWDGIKRTRKGAYTHFLYSVNPSYRNYPRWLKKARKKSSMRLMHYWKGAIYTFHPLMLSMPLPNRMLEMFKMDALPISSEQNMGFRRYITKGEALEYWPENPNAR